MVKLTSTSVSPVGVDKIYYFVYRSILLYQEILPIIQPELPIVSAHIVSAHVVSAHIVSAHRRILGMASVVCVLVKICVSSISLYKLDTDKLTAPFESAHQFTLVCTVSDSKTVPGCHYNLCSNHSFVVTDSSLCLFRAVFSLPGHSPPLLYTDLCLLRPWSRTFFFCVCVSASKVQLSRQGLSLDVGPSPHD